MKKDIIIDNEKDAVDYIQNVLNEWTAFCQTHIKLAQALEVLLEANRSKSSMILEGGT